MYSDYEEKKQAHRRAVTTFIDTRLYPEIAARLDAVFTEYHFTRNGGTWYSTYDINGSDTRKPGALYCTPLPGKPISIGGNGSRSGGVGGTGIEVLKLYADRYHLGGRDEAAEAIAAVLGISGFPKWEGYTPGDSAKEDKREADKIKAAEAFTAALVDGTTAGAEEARAYLLSRFTPEEYKRAVEKHLIGYADTTTLSTLERTAPLWHKGTLQANLGTVHTIAVVTPYATTPADSFNFRALPSKEAEAAAAGKSKYDMPTGTSRDVLGGLPYGVDSVIVVEGEIDRLKASLAVEVENAKRRSENKPLLRGLNVVSVGTNQISEKKAVEAVKRGVKRFTIIPDSDTPKEVTDSRTGKARLQFTHELPGEVGVARSIDTLFKAGAKDVYIAPLPTATDEEGKPEKIDTAEYIKRDGVEAWIKQVNGAKVAALPYLAASLLRKHVEEAIYYGVDEEARDRLFTDLEALIFSPYGTYDTAEKIYAVISQYLAVPGNADYFRFNLVQFKAYVDGRKSREDAKIKEAALKADIEEAYKRTTAGDVHTAAALVSESLRKNVPTAPAEYAALYATPSTDEEIEEAFTEVVAGVPTGIYVHTVEDEKKEITLKEGVSLLVGARKHGKTTILCNIALNEAARNIAAKKEDITAPLRKVLLITYEVRKNRLQRDLLAIYLRREYPNTPGLTKEDITAYYDKKKQPTGEALRAFTEGKRAFFREYLRSGALTIVDLAGRKDVEEVVALLTQYLSSTEAEGGVSLVALDYIQKLTTREKAKATRTEALKYIGEVLTDFGVANKLPILAAAQFNRITNLLQVDTTNIGEAGDLERNAVDVIGVFNLKEIRPLLGSDYTLGFGLHKNIFSKYGIPEEAYIEEVPTGERYADSKPNREAGIAGKEKTRPNIKPIRGKVYISLMASRYGGFPADVITDFIGESGYVDIPGTAYAVEDSLKRVNFWKQVEAERAANSAKAKPTTEAPEEAAGTDEEEITLPF